VRIGGLFARGLLVAACASPALLAAQENVLILVSDDLGVDRTRAYGYVDGGGVPLGPPSAALDRLAGEGLLFRRAWSSPMCSPSRAQALCGKYPNRTGIGRAIALGVPRSEGLRADELTLGDVVPSSYHRAVIGKWHLAGNGPLGSRTSGDDHAPRCGFDLHAGSKGNLGLSIQPYFSWEMVLSQLANLLASHVVQIQNQYATTRTTDDALRVIEACGDQPWLLWVSYNAPHQPYHVPPAHLLQGAGHDLTSDLGRGLAMIEALDSEIGRLLDGIRPAVLARTTVIYFGDNGTKGDLVEAPFDPNRAKGTVYEGGLHVPFIVRSRRIPPELRGGECAALIDFTDLLPTVADLLGVPKPVGLDGTSFLPCLTAPGAPSLRSWVYAELFTPNFVPQPGQTISQVPLESHDQAVRGERFKLIRKRTFTNGQPATESFEFYDLVRDEFETHDLLDAQGDPPQVLQATYDSLLAVLLAHSA
jgi:arylsulfatase A-like enzyme